MEEAYLRMEQGNLRLRAEYESLQKRFDEVSALLRANQAVSTARRRLARSR